MFCKWDDWSPNSPQSAPSVTSACSKKKGAKRPSHKRIGGRGKVGHFVLIAKEIRLTVSYEVHQHASVSPYRSSRILPWQLAHTEGAITAPIHTHLTRWGISSQSPALTQASLHIPSVLWTDFLLSVSEDEGVVGKIWWVSPLKDTLGSVKHQTLQNRTHRACKVPSLSTWITPHTKD